MVSGISWKFDGSTTNPSGTTRLNYGGYLYAKNYIQKDQKYLFQVIPTVMIIMDHGHFKP